MKYNLNSCIDEYLGFQHVNSNIGWKEGFHHRKYN